MIINAHELRKGDIVQKPEGERPGEGPWKEVESVSSSGDTVKFKLKDDAKRYAVTRASGLRRRS